MSRPDGLIELPNGQCIFYDDTAHAYYRAKWVETIIPRSDLPRKEFVKDVERQAKQTGEWKRSTRLTGASTLCKPYSYDSGRLLAWKERMTCEGVADLYIKHGLTDLTWLNSGDAIKAKLKAEALTADDVRDRKADVGTRAHWVLEELAAGREPMPEDGYGEAVVSWWQSRQPTVLNCEQFVYSATHGFAGRFDMRAKLHDLAGFPLAAEDDVYLIDLKTSSWVAPSYHVQIALYDLAARECGVGASNKHIILQVKEDGTWREVYSRATEDDALAAIAVYRGAGRIERESGLPRAKAA